MVVTGTMRMESSAGGKFSTIKIEINMKSIEK
jgi:putative lipoic acid-binding regulatory protein